METKLDVFIDKDNAKWKKKKLGPNDTLNTIRKQLRLPNNIFFLSEKGSKINLEEEEKIFLNSILVKKESSFCLNLITNKADYILINIYLNNQKIHSGSYSKSIKIKDLQKDYAHLLPEDVSLFSDGYEIDPEDYEEKEVKEYLDRNNNLFYKSEENNNIISNEERNHIFGEEEYLINSSHNIFENNTKEESEEKILIRIGKETKIKKLKLSIKLKQLREDLKKEIPFRFKFLDKEICIEENEEYKWTINDILIIENNNKIININNCEIDSKSNQIKSIKFYDDDKYIVKLRLDINQTLDNVRENISDRIDKNFIFMKNRREIKEDEEPDFSLKEIIKNDIVKIKIINDIEEIDENNSKILETNEEKIYIRIDKDTKVKKLRLTETLKELREKLKKELSFRFKFLDKGICVEEDEENDWIINDILLIENNLKIIYIKNCEKENTIEEIKSLKFYDGDKCILKQNFDINQTLENVRENISQRIHQNFHFMKNKREIKEEEEFDFSLKEIIKDYTVKLKIIDSNDKKKNIESFIKFKLNDRQLFANKIKHNLTLFELRKEFREIPENAKFLKDGFEVSSERATTVEDILKDNEFILLRDETEKKRKDSKPKEKNNEIKKYKIYLNGKFLRFYQTKENTTLDDIRNTLSTSISNKEQFISNENEEIPLDNEDQWTLGDYCHKNNKINIKTIKISEPEKPEIKLNQPIQGSIRLKTDNNLTIYQYPNDPFNNDEKNFSKTIMAVGETGSGKTTLLNSFLNFLMGIKFEDNFRYKIIVENEASKNPGTSVTDTVNIYYIRTNMPDMKYVRIVDTPGFGDTRGITYDKKIIDMIRETFTKHCDTINAICFVAKSNETRLTDFQKYIFAQVMALFGKDVGENFIAMLTFSDGQIPNIVESLESKDSIFSQIRDQIQDPWYLTFNNSAIFNGIEQKFSRTFWDLGMDSYLSFARKLRMLPPKSLTLSRKVLELRQKLEATIIGLRPQIERSLGIMENIRKEIAYIKSNKDKIDQFKDFNYKYKEPKVTKKNLNQGQYTSNCIICNNTCHFPCYIPEDSNKIRCSAMGNDGFCTVCKGKCKWDQHKNLNFIYEYEEVEKIKTSEELRKKYVESSSDLKQSEQILKGLEDDFLNILTDCYKNAEEIKRCVEKLKEDSLCKNPNENFEEYIKNCIINEEREKKPGYIDRVKGYKMLKDTNDKIIKAFKGQSIFEDLDKFKAYILKEKEEILKMYEKEEKEGNRNCIIF